MAAATAATRSARPADTGRTRPRADTPRCNPPAAPPALPPPDDDAVRWELLADAGRVDEAVGGRRLISGGLVGKWLLAVRAVEPLLSSSAPSSCSVLLPSGSTPRPRRLHEDGINKWDSGDMGKDKNRSITDQTHSLTHTHTHTPHAPQHVQEDSHSTRLEQHPRRQPQVHLPWCAGSWGEERMKNGERKEIVLRI